MLPIHGNPSRNRLQSIKASGRIQLTVAENRRSPKLNARHPILRVAWYLLILGGLAGCASTTNVEERVRDLNDLGLTDFTLGRFAEARESFDLALQLTPQDANLLFNLAQCDDRLGKHPSAVQYYELCLQKNANHIEARHALIMLYYRMGRKDEANRQIAQWLQEQPDSPEVYALDGWRLRQEKDLIAARDRLFQALAKTKNQKNAHALTELGVLYETMNLPEQSLTYYTRSLDCNPNQPDVIDRVSQLKLRHIGLPHPD